MREFKALDWYTLKGKGQVAVVKNDEVFPREDVILHMGEAVIIDGKTYLVKGVETFAVPTIKKDQLIGLLVVEV